MKREFLLNIIILIVINFLIKPFYLFGIDARIQNLTGLENYGIYATLLSFTFIFQFINDPGIHAFNTKNIAGNRDKLSFHLSRIISIKLVLGFVFLAAVFIVAKIAGFDREFYPLLFIIAINQILSVFFIYLRGNIAGMGMYRKDSFISAIDKFIMIIILGYLAWISEFQNSFKIEWLALGQTAAYLISCIVALIILWPKARPITFHLSRDYAINLLKKSLPYALVLLLMSIYTKIDMVMLERLLADGDKQAGIYAACMRFLEAFNMMGYLFAALLLPMYASMLKEKKDLFALSQIALQLVLVLSVVITISLIIFGGNLMDMLYNFNTPEQTRVLALLISSFIAISVSYIYGTMIMADGDLKAINIVFAIGVLVNILLNLIFIPSMKTEGAAIATIVTQYFVMIGQIYVAHNRFKLKFNFVLFFRTVFFVLLCIMVFAGIKKYFNVMWIYQFALSIMSCGVIAILSGMVKKSMLATLLKRE